MSGLRSVKTLLGGFVVEEVSVPPSAEVVAVYWRDAAHGPSVWFDQAVDEVDVGLCAIPTVSVGIFLKEDGESLVLVQSCFNATRSFQGKFDEPLIIPLGTVERIVRLGTVDVEEEALSFLLDMLGEEPPNADN